MTVVNSYTTTTEGKPQLTWVGIWVQGSFSTSCCICSLGNSREFIRYGGWLNGNCGLSIKFKKLYDIVWWFLKNKSQYASFTKRYQYHSKTSHHCQMKGLISGINAEREWDPAKVSPPCGAWDAHSIHNNSLQMYIFIYAYSYDHMWLCM